MSEVESSKLGLERPLAIVLDIEGTTTAITFVTETLFPYAKKHLPEFVKKHQNDENVKYP